MLPHLTPQIRKGQQLLALGLGCAGVLILANFLGAFEELELKWWDQMVRLRSHQKEDVSDRVLLVTIDEEDIERFGQWPIPDGSLAQTIRSIAEHEPAVIGVDLYRNLKIEPGVASLTRVFEETPNVIGVEKVVGDRVPPHSTLEQLDQTAAADVVVDADGRIRRGLLSVRLPDGQVKMGLAAAVALEYLAQRDIFPEVLDTSGYRLQLGQSEVRRLSANEGPYKSADNGGFQVLMNYRLDSRQFEEVSISDVLAGELSEEQINGRIVLIGTTAVSLNDLFYTPFSHQQSEPGVLIHAHLSAQLLAAALDGRPFTKTLPIAAEWIWIFISVGSGVLVSRSVFYSRSLSEEFPIWKLTTRIGMVLVGVIGTSFSACYLGWWVPAIFPMAAIVTATAWGMVYRNAQLQNLATLDALTQVANRGYFDQYLNQAVKEHKSLVVILCDVDYFKPFNDRYGHPAGDTCLQQVARALKLAVRRDDLVARYGGEEFVVVLNDANYKIAKEVAERIQSRLRQFSIKHEGSVVDEYVTLSGGIAVFHGDEKVTSKQLIEFADEALYKAKQLGRNQFVVSE